MANDSTNIHLLFQKVLGNTANEQELIAFLHLLDNPDIREEWMQFREWEAVEVRPLPEGLQERMASRMEGRPGKTPAAKTSSVYRRIIPYAAAVAVLLVAVWWWYPPSAPVMLASAATSSGEIRTITLPDSTVVTLNARSALRYLENRKTGERIAELEGQGFFEVRNHPGRPFAVHSKGLRTVVLGTRFDVRTYPGITPKIAVADGKVKVAGPNGQFAILAKGNAATYDTTTATFSQFSENPDQVATWQHKLLNLDGLTLKEVCTILENEYNVNIRLQPGIEKLALSGQQPHSSISRTLTSICFVFQLKFEQTGNTFVITKQ